MVEAFINEYREEYNAEMGISADAMLKIQAYHWPGNVRELRNMITRLCIMATNNQIEIEDLL